MLPARASALPSAWLEDPAGTGVLAYLQRTCSMYTTSVHMYICVHTAIRQNLNYLNLNLSQLFLFTEMSQKIIILKWLLLTYPGYLLSLIKELT